MFSVKQTDSWKLYSSVSTLILLFFCPAIKRSRNWRNRLTGGAKHINPPCRPMNNATRTAAQSERGQVILCGGVL